MTADTHPGCVDRTVEAIANAGEILGDGDFVLMVQGDEVMVSPEMNAAIIDAYARTGDAVVNLATRLYRPEDHDDPNSVKVCAAPDGRALFFSRAAIPSRVRQPDVPVYQQTGVIGFRPSFLTTFGTLERTPLEIAEGIDMLRTLEHGLPVRMVRSETETIGVDTPADLRRGEEMLRADPVTRRYLEITP
jgi:3-deoxy-manno-octulosonate cytidylyltransferase (CMP-KDO synthetase)